MLRSLFIYLSKATWARQIVTGWKLSWMVASRFVAGETIDEAIRVIKDLNAKGINATLDHLGESVTDRDEARQAAQEIIEILEKIHAEQVVAGVSIKPSQIGLALDESLFKDNLRLILEKAKAVDNFVRIDMEDSPYTEVTLAAFYEVMQAGFADHVGIVIQAYLYRSARDIFELMKTGARVRLCKGAYDEAGDIAFPKKDDVDANFDVLTEMLISGTIRAGNPGLDGCYPPIPAIASHDEARILFAKQYAEEVALDKAAIEFQMLNGIRRDLQESLVAEGYPVRVYVPYGTEWYPYFVRRLAERPANLWFFISNFFR